jgi:hypothetical protein
LKQSIGKSRSIEQRRAYWVAPLPLRILALIII